MNHTTRYTTLIALLALPALIGCSQLESPAQAAAPGAEDPLGRCSPDETASLCEAACTRMSTCASSSWSDPDHWACTQSCVGEVFRGEANAQQQATCLAAVGDSCVEVDGCLAATHVPRAASSAGAPPDGGLSSALPFAENTEDYCEIVANEYSKCGAWETSEWSVERFITLCDSWGSGFQRKKARCALKYSGNCGNVLSCFALN